MGRGCRRVRRIRALQQLFKPARSISSSVGRFRSERQNLEYRSGRGPGPDGRLRQMDPEADDIERYQQEALASKHPLLIFRGSFGTQQRRSSLSILERDERGVPLRLEHKLRGQQTLLRILSIMGAMHDIRYELRAEGKRQVVAIDVASLLAIHQKQIVSPAVDRNIGI